MRRTTTANNVQRRRKNDWEKGTERWSERAREREREKECSMVHLSLLIVVPIQTLAYTATLTPSVWIDERFGKMHVKFIGYLQDNDTTITFISCEFTDRADTEEIVLKTMCAAAFTVAAAVSVATLFLINAHCKVQCWLIRLRIDVHCDEIHSN